MELVDENEGYYDEEDEEVVDFLKGEQIPTFSLNQAVTQDSQSNQRAKMYAPEPTPEAPVV